MRYYSEVTVKEIIADYDEDVGGIFGELSDYDHIELPEKHRRFIDIDRFIKEERDFYCSNCEKSICKTCWVFLMIDETDQAPTVLEANYRQVDSK